MPNKTIQLDEPALEGQTLTLRIYDGVTLVQNTLATETATTGRFTWTVGAAVTAKEYQIRVYIGSFMAGTYYVYFEDGDVAGTYRVYNFSRVETIEPIRTGLATSNQVTKESIREALSGRWNNGSNYTDVNITDPS